MHMLFYRDSRLSHQSLFYFLHVQIIWMNMYEKGLFRIHAVLNYIKINEVNEGKFH